MSQLNVIINQAKIFRLMGAIKTFECNIIYATTMLFFK